MKNEGLETDRLHLNNLSLLVSVDAEISALWEWLAYHRILGGCHVVLCGDAPSPSSLKVIEALVHCELAHYCRKELPKRASSQARFVRELEVYGLRMRRFAMCLGSREFVIARNFEATLPVQSSLTSSLGWFYARRQRFFGSDHRLLRGDLITASYFSRESDLVGSKMLSQRRPIYDTRSEFFARRDRLINAPDQDEGDDLILTYSSMKQCSFENPADPSVIRVASFPTDRLVGGWNARIAVQRSRRDIVDARTVWMRRKKGHVLDLSLASRREEILHAMILVDNVVGGLFSQTVYGSMSKPVNSILDSNFDISGGDDTGATL